MEAFRKKIKRNFVIYCILIAAFAACYILLQMFGGNNFGNRYISGFFSGAITVLIVNVVSIRKSLKNEKRLKEMYVRESDERLIMIMKETSKTTFYITLAGLGMAVMVASYFNIIVSCTLACVLGSIIFVYLITAVYYKKKM
ncbi:MAG TPA: hypothetical protein P5191_07170 [Ruminococcus sp.]|nr:hypothetical protein [Ruminococcus sp.]